MPWSFRVVKNGGEEETNAMFQVGYPDDDGYEDKLATLSASGYHLVNIISGRSEDCFYLFRREVF